MPDWDPNANDLFLRALDIPEPKDRQRFLEAACAGKPDLRARVGRLLLAGAEAGSFLERPLEAPAAPPPHTSPRPQRSRRFPPPRQELPSAGTSCWK